MLPLQELAQLIEEANQSLEESGTPSHEILVVVLHREIVGHGSIGITLAGGADYETKEITVSVYIWNYYGMCLEVELIEAYVDFLGFFYVTVQLRN